MPYIIATWTAPLVLNGARSCTAVATIEEAREGVQDIMLTRGATSDHPWPAGSNADNWRASLDIGEQGGTIGPMPDGRVIDVRHVSPLKLAALAGASGQDVMACRTMRGGWNFAPIIDKFNGEDRS